MLRGRVVGTICVSGSIAAAVEEAQFTLGEGPSVDAFLTLAPVLVADLTGSDGGHWPGFRDGALAAGVSAVFGFPILVGPVCIGALNLYHDHPGGLTPDQHLDALAIAHVAGRTVLGWQSVAESGALAWEPDHVQTHRAVVHQAVGMASVQAGVTVDDATLLLRAYSFAEERPIADVAGDVVARRLRFDDATTATS